MKPARRSPLSHWLSRTAPGLLALAATERATAATGISPAVPATRRDDSFTRFGFAYDGVLGTSLDAQLDVTTARDARECERRILAEIDRLEAIFSPRNPASEFNRVRAGVAVKSTELANVLAAYDLWSVRTHGALHANLADVVALWKDTAHTGHEPAETALKAAFAELHALAIDALGKAYIVDRAAEIAREFATAGLLNLGGDLRAWGDRSWMIDVANPFDPADNAAPLARIPLRNAAIATSGGYARNFFVGAQRYSHLIDPRTLRPIAPDRAATVVAADCVSANALSTALCVLNASEATPIARAFAFDHLRVGAADEIGATRGFGAVAPIAMARFAEDTAPIPTATADAWPADFQVSLGLSLKLPDGFRAKRPYVAVWVEDAQHHVVRTITVWGGGRYQPDLTKWWRAIGGNRTSIASVTRATRSPGAYTIAWDGRDARGQPVPQGDYTLFVEINREHGHHVWESATVSCGGAATTAELRDTAESDAGTIAYGPRGG